LSGTLLKFWKEITAKGDNGAYEKLAFFDQYFGLLGNDTRYGHRPSYNGKRIGSRICDISNDAISNDICLILYGALEMSLT